MKRKGKRLPLTIAVLAAAVISAGMLQSVQVLADASVKTGTVHVSQFGEYDVNAKVSVDEDRITDIVISGSNYGGAFAEENEERLAAAAKGMIPALKGLSIRDNRAISEADIVSGATYSANAIKKAVLNALELEEVKEDAGVPEQVPEAGEYAVEIRVRTDLIDHSLVENDTSRATLQVDETGNMVLKYTMVSGTAKEPLYILGFNGYYQNNDRSRGLTTAGAQWITEEKNGRTVVTEVSFPLSGLSAVYYANTSLYVPAMRNVNGEISGVLFDNGNFSIDNFISVNWKTLQKSGTQEDGNKSESGGAEEQMNISANVAGSISSPDYTITVPSDASSGSMIKNSAAANTGDKTRADVFAILLPVCGGAALLAAVLEHRRKTAKK